MENTRTTNEPGLPTVSEESSQVGGRLPQAEESFQVEEGRLRQAEGRRGQRNRLFQLFANLQSLIPFFYFCRGYTLELLVSRVQPPLALGRSFRRG